MRRLHRFIAFLVAPIHKHRSISTQFALQLGDNGGGYFWSQAFDQCLANGISIRVDNNIDRMMDLRAFVQFLRLCTALLDKLYNVFLRHIPRQILHDHESRGILQCNMFLQTSVSSILLTIGIIIVMPCRSGKHCKNRAMLQYFVLYSIQQFLYHVEYICTAIIISANKRHQTIPAQQWVVFIVDQMNIFDDHFLLLRLLDFR
mmetsp:Transcript_27996/g.44403  ORF Transcript_27996/g.44403 Transcript_27996/m.44403 type:complete len:203 (-) Transcript_27996:885-1493(-)